jgi:hypothetical protein
VRSTEKSDPNFYSRWWNARTVPVTLRLTLPANRGVSVKHGSLAPELTSMLTRTRKVPENGFEEYATLLIRFFSAARSLDPKEPLKNFSKTSPCG